MSHNDVRGRTVSIGALMTALMAAIFAFQLNASMLAPALTVMGQQLNATQAEIGVTQTGFFAAAALFSLFLPRWGDLAGRKKIMLGMLIATGVGCVVSALATNVTVLGIGRIIQGTSGPIVPLALIMLHQQVTDNAHYAKLMSILTAVNGGIAGLDALLGGWLAETYGFRSVFWTMAGVAVLAVIGVALGTVESRSSESQKMDWPGVPALLVVLGGLYFAFNEMGKLGGANWGLVAGLIVLAAVAFVVFWRIETNAHAPLVTTHYMKQRRTWALLLTTLLTMTGVFAVMNGILPNLAQDPEAGAGMSAGIVSWWTLSPYAIAGLLMGPVAGQLAARWGFRKVLRGGLVLSVMGLVVFAIFLHHPAPAFLLVFSIFLGLTYAGTCNIMLNGLGVVLSPRDNQGYLPGMNSGAFNLGAGLSFAIIFAIQQALQAASGPVAGYRWAVLVGAIIMALAFAASFLIPHPDEVEK
ncbi:MFS transporter [Neoactinobaculum massilliense]|uniref:uridine transporter UriT n=1 Tax=Neoactinobaculum massilliense TaxID=2364794 RepID=UPI000F523C8D|nr:MFS transporter [Neoactinobaculum massilliense]